MEDKLKEKMNTLMYFLTKNAARVCFDEFLEEIGISEDEYEDIKSEFEKFGITKTYI